MADQPKKCSFMIGTEPIELTPKHAKMGDTGGGGGGFFGITGAELSSAADSAWLAEIIFARRRHLSQPVFSANSVRRYTAMRRRLQRRSLPTISEQDTPFFSDINDDDDEGIGHYIDNSSSLDSDPTSPSTLSASSSGSSSSSDDDDFAQKWNKITSTTNNINANNGHNNNTNHHTPAHHHHHHHSRNHLKNNASLTNATADTLSGYYELFKTEDDCAGLITSSSSAPSSPTGSSSSVEDCFAADLSTRLEIEAAAKRKDATPRHSHHRHVSSHHLQENHHHQQADTGVIGDTNCFKVARLL